MAYPKRQIGFTLLEVLIAFIVLTVGLLGTVALQAKAKQASYDSVQRAAALALANDIVQRIRSNDSPTLVNDYKVNFSSESKAGSISSCLSNLCNASQLALYDIEEWKKAIKAKERTGALANASICIVPSSPGANEINLQVVVSWEGRQQMTQSDTNKAISCGSSKNRRMVVIDTYINVRNG